MEETNLEKIASDESGWETLFFNRKSNKYLEKTYPNSEFHGGGTPKFNEVELTENIKKKYKID